MGPVLGLGSEGSVGAYYMVVLQCVPSSTAIARLAGETLVLAVRYRLYRGHVYAGRRQLDYRGSAFLCGNRLIVNRIAVNDQSEGPFLNQEGHF